MSCGGDDSLKESVRDYYGNVLQTTADVKSGVCAVPASHKPLVREAMKLVHEEVVKKNYGCGLPFPEALKGCIVLDLGSGSGRDVYVLSKLVGASGRVIGVDMMDEMLEIANKFVDYHAKVFGYASPNVEFKKGFLEDLAAAGISDSSVGVVISNCVITLCRDKKQVFREAFRALQEGGELFFSDVYCDKYGPAEAKEDEVAWGEGLAGALRWDELADICLDLGYSAPILVTSRPFDIKDDRLKALYAGVRFVSGTYRVFKPDPAIEPAPCSVVYKGTIPDDEKVFVLGRGLEFPAGLTVAVDGALASILKATRFKEHFEFNAVDTIPENLKVVEKVNPFCGS